MEKMSNYVEHANLPHNAKRIVIGEEYKDLLDKALTELETEPIFCPANPYVNKKLASHVDLSVLHTGRDEIFLAPNLMSSQFSKLLEDEGFKTIFPLVNMTEIYPNDSFFNLCVLKDSFFYSPKASEKSIINTLIEKKMKPIPVKQGYCRCAVCIVNDRSIITSDMGIAAAAHVNGINCLLISPGYISLAGYDYGFIGGASFKLSDGKICFTGTLDCHPDQFRILDFLSANNVQPVFLTNKPLFDIGSAVPLTEN